MTPDYSKFHATFHSDDPRHRHGLFLLNQRIFSGQLPDDRAAAILDVGCGRGYALQDLATLGYTNLRGIDVSAGQVAFAQSQGLDVSLVSDTAQYLNARPGEFSVILLIDVLEHVPSAARLELLQAILRSLKPGGRLICSVPNAVSAISSYWFYNDYTHEVAFTNESLKFVLEACGFGQVRFITAEFFPRPRFLFWLPSPRTLVWWLRCCTRLRLRLTLVSELGWQRARGILLTPNLVATADKAV